LLLIKIVNATHIVGGEVYYDYLGNNNYKIHMKVYRDCFNGSPFAPFDGFPDPNGNINPAVFTVFDVSGTAIYTGIFDTISKILVPPTNNSPCVPATSGNACVQEALYEAMITLPPKVGGYYIVYQRCCRNGTILNLINPGGVGSTYWEHIPGPEVVAINNSPRFTKRPPIYICSNIPIAFDHEAIDPDGDSLVYSLCTPFNGLDGCCPIIILSGSTANIGNNQCFNPPPSNVCPTVNSPPPYTSVPFLAPYSASYPLASNPAININSSTGFLNGVPNILGQWVVGVCVSEYRNGQLIGVHHRDFQFNVINCPFVVAADIVSETTTNNGQGTGFCNGLTISYANNSYNGSTYHWDFGDPTTLADTSNVYNPDYTFTTPGIYTVTLIVNPNTLCGDTTTEVFHVFPLLSPDFITPNAQCLNGNTFSFNGTGVFQGTGTFNWNFGPYANPPTASTTSVSNVVFSAPGSYPIAFTVNENGCSATSTKTIDVYQNPIASIGNYTNVGCDPVTINFNNTSTAGTPMAFLWQFSDGTTSTIQNPTHVFSPPGIYSFSLSVITNQKCIDTSMVLAVNSITVTPTPTAQFNYISSTGLCFNSNSFLFNSTSIFQGSTGTLLWNFGNNSNTSTATTPVVTNVSYNNIGTYTVTLTATEYSCSNTETKTIELYENPAASVNPHLLLGCDPVTIDFDNTSTAASAMSYLWQFSDGSTSNLKNPSHVFSPNGIYTYTLTVSTNNKCVNTSSISINSLTVNPTPTASFSATPLIASIFDAEISFYNTSFSASNISWNYTFGDGNSSSDINNTHTYATYGDYNVTQTIINQFGCVNTKEIVIKILPEFRFWVPNAFTPENNDQLNDIFKPIVIGVKEYKFMIFDRWGELLFQTTDTDSGWDGKYKNRLCKQDVYVWKCDFKNIVSKEFESHTGHVTLLQ
jgi:gliding motility-associated-like protein